MLIRPLLAVLFAFPLLGCSPVQSIQNEQSVTVKDAPEEGVPLELHGTLSLAALSDGSAENMFLTLERLQFSEDGKHLMLLVSWREGRQLRSRLAVYRTDTLSLVHSQALHDMFDGPRTGYMSGWLDSGRYYVYATARLLVHGSNPDDGSVDASGQLRILDLYSGAELKRYYGLFGSIFNNDQLLLGPQTLHWETGETFHTPQPTTAFSDFTRSGWALFGERDHRIHRVHPESGAHEHWRSGMRWPWPLATASEEHVVAIGEDGACRVWRLPETKPSGDCSLGRAEARSVKSPSRLAIHPLDERFAVAHGNWVYVYELEPFRAGFEIALPEPASYLALTPGQELIVTTERSLRIWDLSTSEQIAFIARVPQADFLTSSPDSHSVQRISPDGRFTVLERATSDEQGLSQQEVLIYRLP